MRGVVLIYMDALRRRRRRIGLATVGGVSARIFCNKVDELDDLSTACARSRRPGAQLMSTERLLVSCQAPSDGD